MRFVLTFLCLFLGYPLTASARQLVSFSEYFKGSNLGPVKTREGAHFVVSWVNPRDEIVVDALLSHIEKADRELEPLFKNSSGSFKKVPIEIYPDLKTFSAVSQLPLARFKATGTIALTLDQRLMLLSPRNLFSGYPWAVTVVHEYIHYLIREISMDHIPIWLHEGVAQLYQGFPYEKKASLRPSQWGLFKKYRSKNELLSLETLKEPFPMRKDPEEAELAYIQALLFVQWLDQKCGAVQLIRWAEDLKGIDGALEKCTRMNRAQMNAAFVPEVMSKVVIPEGEDVAFFARDFSGQDPAAVEGKDADRTARNFAQLASKLFDQGRYRASAFEMDRAVQKTPAPPPSWQRQLALSLDKSGQTAKSEKVLSKLLNDYPDDAAGWYLMGRKAVDTKNSVSAWNAFLKAFYINPFLDGLEEEMRVLRERNPSLKF